MSKATFEGIKITGLACAVPTHIDKVDDFVDSFGAEIVKKAAITTGVKERHFVEGNQTNSDLCYEAAERLIAHKGYSKESFDGIVLITQTPDYARPATAHILHMRLGLNTDCIAFDINLGCSGFVYGLNVVASMIKAGALKRVLLCCGESHTCLSPKDDQATSMLFGDAGSAVIIEPGDGQIRTGYRAILTPGVNARVKIDPENFDYEKAKETMDGGAVFEFSIFRVPRAFKEFFKTFDETIGDYDYCVFHQANLFMLEHIGKKIKLPKEKMPISMDRYGNTSSVSIPLTIADLYQREDMKEVTRFITAGFGVGLSWGIAAFTLNKNDVLPIIETDAFFEDAYI